MGKKSTHSDDIENTSDNSDDIERLSKLMAKRYRLMGKREGEIDDGEESKTKKQIICDSYLIFELFD